MDAVTAFSPRPDHREAPSDTRPSFAYEDVIADICGMPWEQLNTHEMMRVAKAYYYFSIQFRENLEIACRMHPRDAKLQRLHQGECDTDNLSPWPGITAPGERINHDEFMRRLLAPHPAGADQYLTAAGEAYLKCVRAIHAGPRAASIASYEDGGLTRVFSALLRAPHWHGASQLAFRFFLSEHIRFDNEEGGGHGALSRHLAPDDAILPLWVAFKCILVAAVPKLAAPMSKKHEPNLYIVGERDMPDAAEA
jgi:hypothetical protein